MGEPVGLADSQRRTLGRLTGRPGLLGFYLAGGGAVALHRVSRDLDLFSEEPDADLDAALTALADALPELRVLSIGAATARARTPEGPIHVVRYPFRPLSPPAPHEQSEGFPVAGLRDLAAMKLAAIARRGVRRDLWDLVAIADAGMGLEGCLAAYRERYGRREADLYHVLRALTYFDDAEREPALPRGMTEPDWSALKARLRRDVPRLL